MLDFSYGTNVFLKESTVTTPADEVLMSNAVTTDTFKNIGIGYTSHLGKQEFRTYADVEIGDMFLYIKTLIDYDSTVRVDSVEYEIKDRAKYPTIDGIIYRYLVRLIH